MTELAGGGGAGRKMERDIYKFVARSATRGREGERGENASKNYTTYVLRACEHGDLGTSQPDGQQNA